MQEDLIVILQLFMSSCKRAKVTSSKMMLTFLKPIDFLVTFHFWFLWSTNNFAGFRRRRDVLTKCHHVSQPFFVFLIHSICIRHTLKTAPNNSTLITDELKFHTAHTAKCSLTLSVPRGLLIVTKMSLPKRSGPYWSNPLFLIF